MKIEKLNKCNVSNAGIAHIKMSLDEIKDIWQSIVDLGSTQDLSMLGSVVHLISFQKLYTFIF